MIVVSGRVERREEEGRGILAALRAVIWRFMFSLMCSSSFTT